NVVDSIDGVVDVGRRSRCNREAIDPISVSGDLLELVEVHSHTEIAARDFGRIGATLYYRADDHPLCVGSRSSRPRGESNGIAYLEMRPLRKGFVDRNRPQLIRGRARSRRRTL
ncbi:MAG: hypothetical protein QOK07_3340, partial [Gemmatimonadaceae bacterium]|nr:hypothetical protein [Gemmatimonadaceae bacterium]